MKLVLFDCDGTLVDSLDVIHQCMSRAFVDFKFAEPEQALTRSIIGLSLDNAIARMLSRDIDDEVRAMTARYKHHFFAYRQAGGAIEPFYAGMKSLLDDLNSRSDIILGVVTGKSRRGLDGILAHHQLNSHFVTTRTADECPSKPHPAMVLECCGETGIDPANTIVIGDAVFDMELARNAGAGAIGVSWGYAPIDHLQKAGAGQIAANATELARMIEL